MKKYHRFVLVSSMIVFLIAFPFYGSEVLTPLRVDSAEPAAVEIFQMIPDPDLESEPSAFVNGTSEEFQYTYADEMIQLNWTHIANTSLSFRSPEDTTYPQFNDFVFFTQEFDWPQEELPEDAELYLNYSISRFGNFTTDDAEFMFRVYVWFIDSSENWDRLYYSMRPYHSEMQERRIDLNYFDIMTGWGGMIEDNYGVQQDPEDVLTVAVGLAPTAEFLDYLGSEPWREYNGSVIVDITSIKLYVVMETEPDPATHLEPLYNQTFESTVGDIFPLSPSATNPVADWAHSMTTDPDGYIYLTGETRTSYELFIEEGIRGRHQFLLKYDPVLNRVLWAKNANDSRGRAITYHDDHIFTTGFYDHGDPNYRDFMLTKWTKSGQKVWETYWSEEYDQVGVALGVHSDGSIYVMADYSNIRSEPTFENSTLLKFDSSGILLWEKSIMLSTIFDVAGELWIFESHIVYYISSLLMGIDLDGNILWTDNVWGATSDENGTLYTGYPQFDGLIVQQRDQSGNITWADYYQIEYPNGWFEDVRACDLSLTPRDELLVLAQGNRHDLGYFLLKYDLQGNHLQTWTIGDDYWPLPGGYGPIISCASTGLVYIAFTTRASDVWIQGFAIGEYTLPSLGTDMLTLAAVGGSLVVIVLIGFYWFKKKRV